MVKNIIAACLGVLICFVATSVKAEKLTIAVAANFTAPMKIIAPLFKQQTAIEVLPSFGGTGMLYALINNGAPFDLFLAADQRRPDLLYKEHLVNKPRIYARGQAILWTARKDTSGAATWQEALDLPGMNRIAIANPKLAPYGAAVMAILTPSIKAGLVNRLVYAQNVAQAFQYAQKATDAGFTALSFAMSRAGANGRFWPITAAPLVKQSACIIQSTPHRQAATRFFSFLFSNDTRAVLKKFGYQ